MPYVFIKRVGHPDEQFAKLFILADDVVADLAERACEKFPYWNAHAGQVTLFLVPTARESALDKGDPEMPGDFVSRLSSSTTVNDAVVHRSFLLARLSLSVASAPPGKILPLALTLVPPAIPPANCSHGASPCGGLGCVYYYN
jgi:hypothetical protein